MARSLKKKIAELPLKRREKVEARAADLIAFNHRDLVKSLKRAKRQRLCDVDLGAPQGKEFP